MSGGEILFLAHRLPWPPDRGDKIRSYNILKRLARIAPVHLACLSDGEEPNDALDDLAASSFVAPRAHSLPVAALKGLVRREPLSLGLFGSPAIRDHAAGLIASGRIGCVFAFSAQMAQFVPANLDGARFVMDFVDVDSAKFESYSHAGNPLMRLVNAREGRMLSAYEAQVAKRADASLFVSEAEAALFRRRTGQPAARAFALHNGVDLDFFNADADFEAVAKDGPLLVFTGQMDYRPNIEAVIRFARETLPMIRRCKPATRFAIVGRNPDAAVRALETVEGVIVTGAVPDVRGWLAAADVVVAPLGIARGVQNKVLEAMAMARPVVASSAAFEGIEAKVSQDLIVANGANAESRAICELIGKPARAAEIGASARRCVEARYGWDARLARLPEITGLVAPHALEAAE